MDFQNEPPVDFSNPGLRQAMETALDQVTRQLGRTYPLIIDGKKCFARRTLRSLNPSWSSEQVGVVQEADRSLADRALTAATRAFESWSRVPQEDRAQALARMAQILRRRKMEFIAWLILEVGKNWRE